MDMCFAPNIDGSNPKNHSIAFSLAFGHQRFYINQREINIYLCQSTLLAGIPQFYLTKKQPSNSNSMEENGTGMKHIPYTVPLRVSWAAIRTVWHSSILIGLQGSLQWLSKVYNPYLPWVVWSPCVTQPTEVLFHCPIEFEPKISGSFSFRSTLWTQWIFWCLFFLGRIPTYSNVGRKSFETQKYKVTKLQRWLIGLIGWCFAYTIWWQLPGLEIIWNKNQAQIPQVQ